MNGKIEFRLAQTLPTPLEIRAFEDQLSKALPNDYIAFLQTQNGGKVSPESFKVQWKGQFWSEGYEEASVNWFFGLLDDDDIGLEILHDEFEARIPQGFLPIADDPGSNLILMSLRAEDYGHIMFWAKDHEVDWEGGEEPNLSNMGLIATSFEGFLNGLFDADAAP